MTILWDRHGYAGVVQHPSLHSWRLQAVSLVCLHVWDGTGGWFLCFEPPSLDCTHVMLSSSLQELHRKQSPKCLACQHTALLHHLQKSAVQLSKPRPASWPPPDPGRCQHIEHRRTVSLQHTPSLRVLCQPAATPPMQGCFVVSAQQQEAPRFAAAQAL